MLEDLTQSGATGVLRAMLRFAGARQRLLAHNIANIDTPNYIPMDVSPGSFGRQMRQAVLARRAAGIGPVTIEASNEVTSAGEGRTLGDSPLVLHGSTTSGNVLYHDRNNRDLERMMQALSENQLAFKTAADLLKREQDVLRIAMTGRI